MKKAWIRLTALTLALCIAIAVGVSIGSTLAYTVAVSQTIVNTFMPDPDALAELNVPITVQKTVLNTGKVELGPGGFQFLLTDTATGQTYTATTSENGLAVFNLGFDGLDAGKSFRFTLQEINDARPGVTYSELVYTVDVTLVRQKSLTASVSLDGEEVEHCIAVFENIFDDGSGNEPDTGDTTQIMLYAILLLTSGLALASLRRRLQR